MSACAAQEEDRRKLEEAGCAAVFEPTSLYYQGQWPSAVQVALRSGAEAEPDCPTVLVAFAFFWLFLFGVS